jgi:Rieske Fe-S protein
MACLLDWNAGDRTFDCPCHGVKFLSSGKAAPGAPYAYAPLPAIRTKVESGQVWVYVAGSAANDSSSPADNPHGYATADPTK